MSNLDHNPSRTRRIPRETSGHTHESSNADRGGDLSFSISIKITLDASATEARSEAPKVVSTKLLTSEQLVALNAATEYWRAIYVRERQGIVQIAALLGEVHMHSPTGIDQGLSVIRLFENCLFEGIEAKHLPHARFYTRHINNMYRNLQNAILGPICGWTQNSLVRFAQLAHAVADAMEQNKTKFSLLGKKYELADLSRIMRKANMGDAAKVIASAEALVAHSNRSIDCLENGHRMTDFDMQILNRVTMVGPLVAWLAPLCRGNPTIMKWISKKVRPPFPELTPKVEAGSRDHTMHSAIERRAAELHGRPELVIFGAAHLVNVGELLESSGWTKIIYQKPSLDSRRR